MNILYDFNEGRLTLNLKGELDHHDARDTMRYIESLIDEHMPSTCVMDMAELEFMDSSGIAIMLMVLKK